MSINIQAIEDLQTIIDDLGELSESIDYQEVTRSGPQPFRTINALVRVLDAAEVAQLGVEVRRGLEVVEIQVTRDAVKGVAKVNTGHDRLKRFVGTVNEREYGVAPRLQFEDDQGGWTFYAIA